jgi:uncharacterized protein
MMFDIEKVKTEGQRLKPIAAKLFSKLKKSTRSNQDKYFLKNHQEVFEEINCLDCANCCRFLGPRITYHDIERIAIFLRKKPSVLLETYFKIDEDKDIIFKQMPCPFLLEDNFCSIYEARPKACREYPHTDHKKTVQILDITLKNLETCPAVIEIVKRVVKEY